MASQSHLYVLFVIVVGVAAFAAPVKCNMEVDALYTWRTTLSDPNNVLQSWDPTLVNPCTWFHVTCNSENSVIRVSVYKNNISGSIPSEIGNLKKLISLGLFNNQLRLNNNNLTGRIPREVIQLIINGSLRILNVANNSLAGTMRAKNSTGYAITSVIQDPRARKY
ncbi:hypothetical protein CICLE_v10033830mg [Citrus x clementina]|uniref:Leucine-rich repeat-containing N-terminal plant-type domain-containing protein n=1 Tax=Citrus clementina TaxID=85681 RepID=V4TFG0_CITCL|nr:hypothetical protein CICLE_v10033830mg [Citrus x clementina]